MPLLPQKSLKNLGKRVNPGGQQVAWWTYKDLTNQVSTIQQLESCQFVRGHFYSFFQE